TPNGLSGDANSLYSLKISNIPSAATLSNAHGDTLTVSGGSITFNASQLANGVLSGLAITPGNDKNLSLSVTATEQDREGNLSTPITSTEAITVDPLAPTVTIVGTAQEGQTLTAHATTSDSDVALTYQWQSFDGV